MIIDRIREKLAVHPSVRYTADAHTIRIHPEHGGFEVGLSTDNNSLTVSFEGWHEEFQNEEEALNCLAFGLSESCRLRVLRKGSVDYKWIVEARAANGGPTPKSAYWHTPSGDSGRSVFSRITSFQYPIHELS